MDNQTTIFEMLYPTYKITKKIRTIELFGGYGSQLLSLKYINTDVEQWKLCEWAVKSIQAYKDIHFEEDTKDYSKYLKIGQIKEFLFNKGISSNYNEPMTKEQINRLNDKQVRTIYNNIQATHNLVNIQQVKGKDLEIIDTDKYDYILTYSFPCQDISGAGLRKGFEDNSTRSGMLWEVERILTECKELGTLPKILLMENVPLVHGADNINSWNRWQLRLEELGYKNYWQDLIATDYGIPQTRNRTFMVSILGDYNYTFPKPIPLKLKLKDMLEDNVDEKYYLSDKMLNGMINTNFNSYKLENRLQDIDGTIDTLLTSTGSRCPHCIPIKNATKKGYLEAEEGDGIDISGRMEYHRGTVQKGKTQTLTTSGGENNGVCVGTYQYSKSENFMKGKDRLQLGKEVSDTLQTTQKEGVVNSDLRIRKLTPKECFRLMGVKDEDFDKIAKNQSDSSLYHLAGDSIVTNCLCAIFKQLI